MNRHMLDISRYLQRRPDLKEDVPETVRKDADTLRAKLAIIDLLPVRDGSYILDVGSAGGWAAYELQERLLINVTALTLFEEEAVALRRLGLTTLVCDMHTLPAALADTFHIVRASHVLEHSPAPYIAMREFARVLAPGGTLQIVMPDADGYTRLGTQKPRRLGSFAMHHFCASTQTTIELIRAVKLEFVSYREVAQMHRGQRHYWHRVWMARKPDEAD